MTMVEFMLGGVVMHMDVEDRSPWCGCEGCARIRESQRRFRHVALVVTLVVLSVVACLCAKAFASTGPSMRWRGYEKALAQVIVAEADGSVQDWSAILWTLDHRIVQYGDTPARTLSYSATTHSELPRAQTIQVLGFREVEDDPRSKQMVAALQHVREWINGKVLDPCPEAIHWHGKSDARPRWFEPVACGETRNTFGKLKARR